MLAYNKAERAALIGYALAAVGLILFSLLGKIQNLSVSDNVLNAAAVGSFAATLVGFVIATVASAIWAGRGSTRQPLKIAASIGVGSFLLSLAVGINIHGSSAMLMFVVLFSAVNVLSLLVVTHW